MAKQEDTEKFLENWDNELLENEKNQFSSDQLEIFLSIGKLQESMDRIEKKQKLINRIILVFIFILLIVFIDNILMFFTTFIDNNFEGVLSSIIASILILIFSTIVYKKIL